MSLMFSFVVTHLSCQTNMWQHHDTGAMTNLICSLRVRLCRLAFNIKISTLLIASNIAEPKLSAVISAQDVIVSKLLMLRAILTHIYKPHILTKRFS
jgi:hypothetical protein